MGRSPCCSKEGLKRGPWSTKEDSLLTDYILRNGEGQWRSLPNKAGLLRCGKSCRLRWMNYLRPGIKRGNISQDEEDLIVRLHALLGNRWSLIAGRLPGRTDNEIKNYWNTHLLKKLTIAGLHPKALPPAHNKTKKKKTTNLDSSAAPEPDLNSHKIEDKLLDPPPKIKVYSPKPMRVSPGFSRSSSYDSSGSGASSSSEKAAGVSYGWFGAEERGEEDDFLGAEGFLPLLQQQLDAVGGDERMLDLVYDEYLQLL